MKHRLKILISLLSLAAIGSGAAEYRSINAKAFGAVGDGVANDTVALQNALNYLSTNLIADAGVCLFLPQGTYLITNRLSFVSTNALGSYQGITIRGEGKEAGQTKIWSKSTAGVLLFNIDSTKDLYNFKVQIEDLQIGAGTADGGAAIEIAPTQEPTNLWVRVTPYLRNVKITRDDSSCYFTYGLKGDHLRNPTLDSVDIAGNCPGMKAGFYVDHSYAYILDDSYITDTDIAVDAPHSAEGNKVNRCVITNVNIGIRIFVDTSEMPGPSSFGGGIFNSSISAFQTGIYMDRKQYFFVADNIFSKAGSGAAYTNIYWKNVQRGIVSGNRFAGGENQRGIVLENGGINTVAYNEFGSFAESVVIGTKVPRSMIIDNTNIQTNVVDNGTNTYVVHGTLRAAYNSPANRGTGDEEFRWTLLAYTPMVNVTDYGAKGDGVTDDTTAITAAAKQVKTNLDVFGQGSLYFPAGKYKLSQRIDLSQTSAVWQEISIFGDGDQVSTILGTGTNGIFKITCTNQVPVKMHDLSMMSGKTNTQAALDINQDRGTNDGARSLVMHNVRITKSGTTYFKTGISAQGLVRPLFKNVSTDLVTGFGTLGYRLAGGYGAEFDRCALHFVDAGFNINSLGGEVLFRGSLCAAWADPGIWIDAGGGKVALQDTHIDTVNNLVVTNAGEFSFVNTLTLNREDGDHPDRATLRIAGCTNVFIRDNIFSQSGVGRAPNTQRVSVRLAGDKNSDVDISGNMFEESGTGIAISKDSTNVSVYDNRFIKSGAAAIINYEPTAAIGLLPPEVPTAPAAKNQSVTVIKNTAINLVLTATDIDSTNLTYAVLDNPSYGSLSGLNPNTGEVTYTPGTNYFGSDSFTFTVSDGSLSSSGTVSLAVMAGVNTNTGTPMWWLTQYGLTNFEADAIADADGDGLLTWQEYIAGTNPTNSASSLRIFNAGTTAQGATIVRWSSVSNRFYDLSRTTNLLQSFAAVVGATNLPATPPENVYTNPAPDGAAAFYRISVHE